MKKFPIWIVWCLVALVIFGCGGGGGVSTTGTTATTGSTATSKTIAYDTQGFCGTLVNSVSASSTPQTVQVSVNGTVRSVSDVIVIYGGTTGDRVSVLKSGTQLLNVTIADPSGGAAVGVTSLRVPISSDGKMVKNVLSTLGQIALLTPPATWQGYSLPNGVQFTASFTDTTEGDRRVYANSTVQVPNGVGDLNGNTTYSYSSVSAVSASVGLTTSDSSAITMGGLGGAASQTGLVTAPWRAYRLSNDPLVFTDPEVEVHF